MTRSLNWYDLKKDKTSENTNNHTQNRRNKNSTTANINNLSNDGAINENNLGAVNTNNTMIRTFTNSKGVVAGVTKQSL